MARGLDGDTAFLTIEFHHDDKMNVTVKAFDRQKKGRR